MNMPVYLPGISACTEGSRREEASWGDEKEPGGVCEDDWEAQQ